MIIDITGTILIPGNDGKDCPGNGVHVDEKGEPIECCCNECDYLICCCEEYKQIKCMDCTNSDCPRRGKAESEDGMLSDNKHYFASNLPDCDPTVII